MKGERWRTMCISKPSCVKIPCLLILTKDRGGDALKYVFASRENSTCTGRCTIPAHPKNPAIHRTTGNMARRGMFRVKCVLVPGDSVHRHERPRQNLCRKEKKHKKPDGTFLLDNCFPPPTMPVARVEHDHQAAASRNVGEGEDSHGWNGEERLGPFRPGVPKFVDA